MCKIGWWKKYEEEGREREKKTKRNKKGDGATEAAKGQFCRESWRRDGAGPPPLHCTVTCGNTTCQAPVERGILDLQQVCACEAVHTGAALSALTMDRGQLEARSNFLLTEDSNQIHILPPWSTSGAWMGSRGRPPALVVCLWDWLKWSGVGGNRWSHLLKNPRGGRGSGPFWVSLADRDRDGSAEGKVLKFPWVTGSCSICGRRQPWRGNSGSARRKASQASQNS